MIRPEPSWIILREGYCRHCQLHTSLRVVDRKVLVPRWSAKVPDTPPSLEGKEARTHQETLECQYCHKATVLLKFYDPEHPVGGEPREIKTVYPAAQPRALDLAVPEKIRSVYEEAALCEVAGALRAAAVMYRAAVEEICKERGTRGKNLRDRIEALRDLGLDAEIIDDMHEARILGNDSIHDGLVYSPDEVADVANLIEEALLVLYVQPAQKAAMREKRRQRRMQTQQQQRPAPDSG